MSQKALLFIPDISGFTEFVHHTAMSHSRHIISELLELLIDTNTMHLQLAEIEGDALFFYKLEDTVDLSAIEQQIEAMYLAFHTHIKRYEYQRICHCGACSSAHQLKIKFVVHYGEIEFITVKDNKKPYGSTVIQAHRLLKNDIPEDEYALFTKAVNSEAQGDTSKELLASYDFGEIAYVYNPLAHLKIKLPQINFIPKDVPKQKLFDQTVRVNINISEFYEIISNFDYRLLWNAGIDELEYQKNKINRAGIKHKCLINNTSIEQTTVTREVEKNQLVYGESTTEIPFLKRMSAYFILEEINPNTTTLQVEVFADFKSLGFLFKPLIKKNLRKNIPQNIEALVMLINSGFKTKEYSPASA